MTLNHKKEELSGAKYIIIASFEVNGEVDSSDIVGAIFGNTEGLLGEELELRELLRYGRIGRINVDFQHVNNKTIGKLYLPSSVDKIETALIAAALETVDKVGPYNAIIRVEKVKDVRQEKLQRIIDRASELLAKWPQESGPDTKEIIEQVRKKVNISEIIEYGPERLPAGPAVESSEEIIIVEGRADVLNLLRAGFRNAIATNGVDIPDTIIELSKQKRTIVFPDHDRMGIHILRQLLQRASVDYVALPPPEKVVEKLSIKEIHKALKNKVPAEQAPDIIDPRLRAELGSLRAGVERKKVEKTSPPPREHEKEAIHDVPLSEKYMKYYEEARKEGIAVFLDENDNEIKRCAVSDVFEVLQEMDNAKVLIYKGVVTQRIVDLCSEKGLNTIVAMKQGHLIHKPDEIKIITMEGI